MMAAVSPSSSPRLPSPPPMAEDQVLGPKSPIAASEDHGKFASSLDHGAARRIRPGTKADDMAEGPPLVDVTEIDSAFQLTEHLKALHNFLTHPIGATNVIPVDREMAHKLAQPPDNVDKALWLYELCRFLTQKVNSIIIALFSDSPPCSSQTCPEMRASEWQYLCAVHDPPKSCCAIDYCCHTLDWAANTLTSPKHFPSRLALGGEANTAHQQVRQLTNIFRRVYRIFAHAWFQHREMFWKVEGRSGLYVFFKTVCDVYSLIPEDNFTIPPEAEGIESTPDTATIMNAPMIMKRDDPDREDDKGLESIGDHTLASGNTTKRHRATHSVGATSVMTVVEENEDDDDQQLSGQLSLSTDEERAAEQTTEPAVEPAEEEIQDLPSQEESLSEVEVGEPEPAESLPEKAEDEVGSLKAEETLHSGPKPELSSEETRPSASTELEKQSPSEVEDIAPEIEREDDAVEVTDQTPANEPLREETGEVQGSAEKADKDEAGEDANRGAEPVAVESASEE